MASIITATTTSGLTQSADNSGVLQLASGTGNLVTVPSVTGTAMVSGNMPAFSAYASAGVVNITQSTYTKVTFGTEEFDTNSNFASSRFTPTVAGYYQITGAVYASGGGGMREVRTAIYKNGSIYKNSAHSGTNATSPFSAPIVLVTSLVYFNGSSDYVEIYTFMNDSASSAYYYGANTENTYFNGCLVRGA